MNFCVVCEKKGLEQVLVDFYDIRNGNGLNVPMEAIEQATTFGLNMVTLPSHTSHARSPLGANCFKPFKNAFNN
jgi:hypothetical protein